MDASQGGDVEVEFTAKLVCSRLLKTHSQDKRKSASVTNSKQMMTSTGLDCKFHRGALWTEINQQDRLSVWNASRVSRLRAMKAFMKSQGVLNAHWCVPRNAISFRVTPKMPFIGVGVTGLTMSIDVYCGHPNKFGKNLDCPSLDGRVDRETVIP